MGMLSFFTGSATSSAKVADGRLVLSMPDAETPVVWVMDLADSATAVLRLETDKNGYNVLRKYTGKGAAETIAVYRARDAAENALTVSSKALENARNSHLHKGANGQPVVIKRVGWMNRIFHFFLYGWFIIYLSVLMYNYVYGTYILTQRANAEMAQAGMTTEAPANTAQQPRQAQANPKTGTVGVPLSADDFLNNRNEVPPPR